LVPAVPEDPLELDPSMMLPSTMERTESSLGLALSLHAAAAAGQGTSETTRRPERMHRAVMGARAVAVLNIALPQAHHCNSVTRDKDLEIRVDIRLARVTSLAAVVVVRAEQARTEPTMQVERVD